MDLSHKTCLYPVPVHHGADPSGLGVRADSTLDGIGFADTLPIDLRALRSKLKSWC